MTEGWPTFPSLPVFAILRTAGSKTSLLLDAHVKFLVRKNISSCENKALALTGLDKLINWSLPPVGNVLHHNIRFTIYVVTSLFTQAQ